MKAPMKKTNKIVESVKKGFADIRFVLEEGNYQLFLKQAIVIVVLILGYRWCNDKLQKENSSILGQVDAVQTQHLNEADYLANKKKLLDLEPRFPDASAKNDWLLRQTVAVFNDSQLEPQMTSSQTETASGSGYTQVSLPVNLEASYSQLGNLVANIENRDAYLRISEISLDKSSEVLGENKISISLNTIFPKEKIASKMFKDAPNGGNR